MKRKISYEKDVTWVSCFKRDLYRTDRDKAILEKLTPTTQRLPMQQVLIASIHFFRLCFRAQVSFVQGSEVKPLDPLDFVKQHEKELGLRRKRENITSAVKEKDKSPLRLKLTQFDMLVVNELKELLSVDDTPGILRLTLRFMEDLHLKMTGGCYLQFRGRRFHHNVYANTSELIPVPLEKASLQEMQAIIERIQAIRADKTTSKDTTRHIQLLRTALPKPTTRTLKAFFEFVNSNSLAGATLPSEFYHVVAHSTICLIYPSVLEILDGNKLRFISMHFRKLLSAVSFSPHTKVPTLKMPGKLPLPSPDFPSAAATWKVWCACPSPMDADLACGLI